MYRESSKKLAMPVTGRSQKNMKSLEETYGVKYGGAMNHKNNPKMISKNAASVNHFKDRGDMEFGDSAPTYRANYNKYLITSSDRYGFVTASDGPELTARRKTVSFHPDREAMSMLDQSSAMSKMKQEQYFKNQTESTVRTQPSSKQARTARERHVSYENMAAYQSLISPQNKIVKEEYLSKLEEKKARHEHHHLNQQRQQQQQQQQQQQEQYKQQPKRDRSREELDEDKDDDTEEFIALIKRAVEKSVAKAMSEVLNKTFADFNKRLDQHTVKLSNLSQKLHNSLSGKVSHYGEENSRHFRYLCMKSEYDKMFYQHHSQLATKPNAPPTQTKSSSTSTNRNHKSADRTPTSTRTLVPEPPLPPSHQKKHQIHSETSKRSLDENMRDMVAQLKRFCLQYESSVILGEEVSCKSATSGTSGLLIENAYQSRLDFYQDEETNPSSDGMTPRTVENISLGTETFNSMMETSNGAGDA